MEVHGAWSDASQLQVINVITCWEKSTFYHISSNRTQIRHECMEAEKTTKHLTPINWWKKKDTSQPIRGQASAVSANSSDLAIIVFLLVYSVLLSVSVNSSDVAIIYPFCILVSKIISVGALSRLTPVWLKWRWRLLCVGRVTSSWLGTQKTTL